jgi:hypothetical protein
MFAKRTTPRKTPRKILRNYDHSSRKSQRGLDQWKDFVIIQMILFAEFTRMLQGRKFNRGKII